MNSETFLAPAAKIHIVEASLYESDNVNSKIYTKRIPKIGMYTTKGTREETKDFTI